MVGGWSVTCLYRYTVVILLQRAAISSLVLGLITLTQNSAIREYSGVTTTASKMLARFLIVNVDVIPFNRSDNPINNPNKSQITQTKAKV